MSERQGIYRYAVEKEGAMQQQNMTNGVFDTVRPLVNSVNVRRFLRQNIGNRHET